MALKLTTAGESHGPGLTCIVEGLPAGLELDREAIDRDMARRQLGHGRGGRMKIERDRAEVTRRRPPRAHAGRPDRPAGRQPRLRQLGGADEPVAGRGRGAPRSTCRAPATPTSSATWKYGLDRRPQRARARQRPRDRRPRGRRRAGQGLPARARRRGPLATCVQIGSVRAPERDAPLRSEDFDGVDDDPVRCLDPEASRAMVERDQRASARPTSRSAASSRCVAFGLVARAGLAHLLGGAASTAASPARCARSRPSRASRSAKPSTSPGARAPRPTTRSSGQRGARLLSARPTTPAASRAG